MKGRLENKQSKILQPPVSDKGLSLLYSETDLLAFQQELYQESGLCSDLLGVLFPLCEGEVCFYPRTEMEGRGEQAQGEDPFGMTVQDHPVVRCGIGIPLRGTSLIFPGNSCSKYQK